ncbi:hypothetical protein L2E82_39630 [Cichorium intybus]|uniref:Uncharacterized protein n=1 Tax=Cichorium intybus TaxID=13427 RepID=A0ACB9AI91_CICIN|nr:hypothetical protein L2E82_39630 [Cichorium intybus]
MVACVLKIDPLTLLLILDLYSISDSKKRLYRAYQRLYASMHDKVVGPHKTQFRRDDNYGSIGASITCYVGRA